MEWGDGHTLTRDRIGSGLGMAGSLNPITKVSTFCAAVEWRCQRLGRFKEVNVDRIAYSLRESIALVDFWPHCWRVKENIHYDQGTKDACFLVV